jgi:mannosylglycerate hydrolase
MHHKYTGIVVSTTHWDRAWYWPFQQFRIRLVQLMDHLIEILNTNSEYTSFTLDGQTVPLEDYLEVKPEMRAEVERLVRDKRLVIGPWYVLPDVFLVSGESLVRNLMLGHKIGNEFGGVMKEGYVPDPFSHIDQMPQILSGFNLCSFLFMRGMGEQFNELGTEFLWEAPDGSRIFTIYLKEGYFNVGALGFPEIFMDHRDLPSDFDIAVKSVRSAVDALKPFNKTGYMLLFNGADHSAPQPYLPEIISYVNKHLSDVKLVHGTISDYVDAVLKEHDALKIYKGEFVGNAHHLNIRSVYSSRMYLKQMNDVCQNLLERYAEPIAAFAALEGKRDFTPFNWQAWKLVLKCHPHDDICGCSVDAVHRDMVNRFEQAEQIGTYVKEKAFQEFAQSINTSGKPGQPIVVFNSLNWVRSDVVRMEILFPQDDALAKNFTIVDAQGDEVPFMILRQGKAYRAELLDWKYYDSAEVEFIAKDVPPCGYVAYYVVPKPKRKTKKHITSLKATNRSIENEFFKVTVNSNGTLKIFDKKRKKTYDGCNLFEDTEDDGGEYTYSFVEKTQTVTSAKTKASVSLVSHTAASATLKIAFTLLIPESLSEDRKSRSKKKVVCLITSYVTLYAGINRIDIRTEVENNAKDHRLRVWFPTDFAHYKNYADGHFDVVERPPYFPKKPAERGKIEWYATQHQGHFTTLTDGKYGLTIANKGLPEYEIVKEKGRTAIAITLLRCVGWLNKNNLMTRWRMAGPDLPTPEAQCLGKHTFEYSMIPHGNSWDEAKSYKAAYQFVSPLAAFNVKKSDGKLADVQSFVSVEPDELVVSAIKKSERGDGLIVRFYNITDEEVVGKISAYKNIVKAGLVNLNEEFVEALSVNQDNIITLQVEKCKIVTVDLLF